jgi:putative DNA modification/repair radical SAM protein
LTPVTDVLFLFFMDPALARKLRILADAAKYDASCASSGAPKRVSTVEGLGSTTGSGICHSYTPDGRCVSLLKILLTNYCLFDCAYCINRRSSNTERARFTVSDVVTLTLEFYKRNYIEGLFLSSGIIRTPDYTMEQLILVAKTLRQKHGFAGYIHLKTIPEANPWLIEQAGLWADRLSVNLELPSQESLTRLAPEKNATSISTAMGHMKERITEAREERRHFSPAGQSTQIIIGADDATDSKVLGASTTLYKKFGLSRVYYSAFSPIPEASAVLPLKSPPLQRENRLYQADWLYRYYGFSVDEIMDGGKDGMLDLAIDPKLAWALKHRDRFPVDVNAADRELLLRVPGLGTRAVDKILSARRHTALRFADVKRLSSSARRASAFMITADHHPHRLIDRMDLRAMISGPGRQLQLFA